MPALPADSVSPRLSGAAVALCDGLKSGETGRDSAAEAYGGGGVMLFAPELRPILGGPGGSGLLQPRIQKSCILPCSTGNGSEESRGAVVEKGLTTCGSRTDVSSSKLLASAVKKGHQQSRCWIESGGPCGAGGQALNTFPGLLPVMQTPSQGATGRCCPASSQRPKAGAGRSFRSSAASCCAMARPGHASIASV